MKYVSRCLCLHRQRLKNVQIMPKILQLSVLDTVMHPRIYYKYGLSFADLGFEVKIVAEKKHEILLSQEKVKLIALPPVAPTTFARLKRQMLLWQIAWQDKPEILMIHAIELTFLAFLYKMIRPKTYVIYDVFEDYEKNVFYNPMLSHCTKKVISLMLRPLERFFAKYFDAVCYAENCYNNILNILPEKKFIFLNKFSEKMLDDTQNLSLPNTSYMLYTGTLEENWGILQTIDVWIGLNQIEPLHLVIAGFTYDTQMISLIHQKVAASGLAHLFTLYGGNQYVPYSQIVHLIRHCKFGTGLYVPTPSIVGKIPTKFFEYMSLGKPLIFTDEPYWNQLNENWKFGISKDKNMSFSELLAKINIFKPSLLKAEANWNAYLPALKKLTKHV